MVSETINHMDKISAQGKLFICATPIGNLEDVSIRLLKTLNYVDLIACEDTRHTIKLLNHYGIKKPLVSYHEHSSSNREAYLIDKLLAGENIALVSDAGMPTISDPGENLIKSAILHDIGLEVIPGPSALTAALAISGLDTSSFTFLGFLPSKSKRRRDLLRDLAQENRTIVIYESPYRLLDTLNEMSIIMGKDRPVAIARELTKIYEEVKRGSLEEVLAHYEENPVKGEICILIGVGDRPQEVDFAQVIEEVRQLIDSGVSKKEAFKMKAREYSIKKSSIYNYFVKNDD